MLNRAKTCPGVPDPRGGEGVVWCLSELPPANTTDLLPPLVAGGVPLTAHEKDQTDEEFHLKWEDQLN